MYTLDELATELNRQEWAVRKMLINRGYLKKNGDPRKTTIDDGLMNRNGLIKESGWSVFCNELGYKDSDDDEIEKEPEDEDYEIERRIKAALSSEISDEILLDDLVSQLFVFYNQENEEDDEEWEVDNIINDFCSPVIYYFSQGHTDTFLRAFVSDYDIFVDENVDETYTKMTEDEIYEDIESVLRKNEYNENTIRWAREEEFREFSNIFSICDRFEKIFNEAVEKGNDEELSCKYTRQRMITDDFGFEDFKLETYPTSLDLDNISDENKEDDITNWIEEKYQITIISLNLDENVLFFDKAGLIYKSRINYLDKELKVENYYLPSDKQSLGL